MIEGWCGVSRQAFGGVEREDRTISFRSNILRVRELSLSYEEDKRWQLLILDIEMGKMNGVELAKKVREHNKENADFICDGLYGLYF